MPSRHPVRHLASSRLPFTHSSAVPATGLELFGLRVPGTPRQPVLNGWFGETPIFRVTVWNHVIETNIWNWLFRVPGEIVFRVSLYTNQIYRTALAQHVHFMVQSNDAHAILAEKNTVTMSTEDEHHPTPNCVFKLLNFNMFPSPNGCFQK